jgi:hypothetical protein
MIHHVSISAHEPERVARVLAELMDGFVLPFPPSPGAFMAVARDGHGTGVEVHPAGTVLDPEGDAQGRFARVPAASALAPFHIALSTPRSPQEVAAIARREGWRCAEFGRGGDFEVIELWLEDRLLVELLPPALAARYLAFAAQLSAAADPGALMASHALA